MKDGQTGAEDRSAGILKNVWARSVDDVRAAVNRGVPCSLGKRWYSSFDEPKERTASGGSAKVIWAGCEVATASASTVPPTSAKR